jgi:hypothetical protein
VRPLTKTLRDADVTAVAYMMLAPAAVLRLHSDALRR